MKPEIATYLQWDSDFFGQQFARASIHRLDETQYQTLAEWCHTHAIDCLYFLADSHHPQTIAVLEKNIFQFVDIRIVYETKIKQINTTTPPHITLRLSKLTDFSTLQSISHSAYAMSRFYADRCIANGDASRLYDIWLQKSIETDFADAVVVAELDQQPVGYVTCHIDTEQESGHIGLVGVAETARGNQIGQHMMNYALSWFADHSVTSVSVATQGRNIGAQRLYQRSGFLTRSVELWYHKWFTECPEK